jgi:hypothetical protein
MGGRLVSKRQRVNSNRLHRRQRRHVRQQLQRRPMRNRNRRSVAELLPSPARRASTPRLNVR